MASHLMNTAPTDTYEAELNKVLMLNSPPRMRIPESPPPYIIITAAHDAEMKEKLNKRIQKRKKERCRAKAIHTKLCL